MKIDAYIKFQEQLDKIQLKLEIFNLDHTYYIEQNTEELLLGDEIRQYMETDYTKMF